MHFFSLLIAAGTAALALAGPIAKRYGSKPVLEAIAKRNGSRPFKYFGINEAGAEFGKKILPGVEGKNYIWPFKSSVDTLAGRGLNAFRVPFSMERLNPGSMTGPADATYLGGLVKTVNYITRTKGAYAIVDPHNYGRYHGAPISDCAGFQTFWQNLAGKFASNPKVLFDTNNEYHDMDQQLVVRLNQAAINGIRAAGATRQPILVEGNAYTGAWTWISSGNGASLLGLTDPSNNIIYQMHQYLDKDGSGTHPSCVSPTIGAERIAEATKWLKDHGKKGIIGEYAGGDNPRCRSALQGMLRSMAQNADVWTGALWWGGGPWWGDYMFSMEPPHGVAYVNMLPMMLSHM